MQTPDHRALNILELAQNQVEYLGDSSVERDFFYLVKHHESTLVDVEIAYEIYQTEEDRHVFDALILGGASDDLIVDALKCPPGILMPYRHLFCDRTVFRHTPAVLRYIRELEFPEDLEGCREYYDVAARQGPEYLANRFRVGERPDVEPRKVIKTAVSDMYDRFLAHRGKSIDSAIAKEAFKWGTAAVSASVVLIEKGGDTKKNAMEDLKILLEVEEHTSTPEEAGVDLSEVLTG